MDRFSQRTEWKSRAIKKIKKNKMAGGRQTTASSSLQMMFQKLP